MKKNTSSLNFLHDRGYAALLMSILLLSLLCAPIESFAVMGSDWHIKTPGGNAIYGGDRCEGLSSVCLTDGEASMIYAHHLRRWRYYFDYIIGEQEEGSFIFHEPSGTFQHFEDKTAWKDAPEPILRWLPLSGWITRDHGILMLDWLPRLFGNFMTLDIGIGMGLWLIYALVKRAITKKQSPRKRKLQNDFGLSDEGRERSVEHTISLKRPAGITIVASLYVITGGGMLVPALWIFLFFPFTSDLSNALLSTLAVVGGVGLLLRKEWGWWAAAAYAFLMPGLYIARFLRNFVLLKEYYASLFNGELPLPGSMLYSALIFTIHVVLAVYVVRGPLSRYCRVRSPKPFTRLLIIVGGALGLSVIFNLRPLAQSPDTLLKMLVQFLVGGV